MAKYRVLETSFIDNKLVQPGDEIDYEGEASSNLEPIKAKRGAQADPGKVDDPLA